MTKKVSDDQLENVSGGTQEIQQSDQTDGDQSGGDSHAMEIEFTDMPSPLRQKSDR